jgi:putative redox protein
VDVAIDLQDGMHFTASGADGHSVRLDSSDDFGGTGRGFRPMELLLVGLGSCTAMDVVSILRKKRHQVEGYRIEVSGEQATDYPHVFTHIAIRHVLRGKGLTSDSVQRAIDLSEQKYCPAYAMLSKAATITTSFEIVEAPTD